MKKLRKKKKLKKKRPQAKNKQLLLVGLGNPGDIYRETRHNAGFAVIDQTAANFNAELKKPFLRNFLIGKIVRDSVTIHIIKPLTFMNRSGDVLSYIMRKTGTSVDDMILICDNMDLKPGMIRLKIKGSSAGHNGIKSIIDNTGRSDFKRLYIGVGRPDKGESIVDHVLGRFSADEQELFNESIEQGSEALISLSVKPLDQVMSDVNKKNN